MTYLKSIWTGVDCRWGTWGVRTCKRQGYVWNYAKTKSKYRGKEQMELSQNKSMYKLFLSIKINKHYQLINMDFVLVVSE